MLKKMLALGLMVGLACAGEVEFVRPDRPVEVVEVPEPVEFWRWSEEGRAAFEDIENGPVCQRLQSDSRFSLYSAERKLRPQIEILSRELPTLQGGARCIRDRLIYEWISSGINFEEGTQKRLFELADCIYYQLEKNS